MITLGHNAKYFAYLIAFVVCIFSTQQSTRAQLSPSLSISPAKYELTVNPSQPQQTTIKLTNRSDGPIPIHAEVMDFAPKDDTGGIEFGRSLPNHSAKEWLTINNPDFILLPSETRLIGVNLNPPDSINPGSYFAVVMFQATLPTEQTDKTTQAQIVPWIGELYLLKVGDIPTLDDNALIIKSFSYPKINRQRGVPIVLEVANNSSYHLTPQAHFRLNSIFGMVVAEAQNDNTTILPGSVRKFEVTLKRENPLGLYRANATVLVAGVRKTANSDPLIIITTLGILIALGGLYVFVHGLHHGVRHRHRYRNRFAVAWEAFKRPNA